jgi:hypothetical protein
MKMIIPEQWHSSTQGEKLDQATTSHVGCLTVQMDPKEQHTDIQLILLFTRSDMTTSSSSQQHFITVAHVQP